MAAVEWYIMLLVISFNADSGGTASYFLVVLPFSRSCRRIPIVTIPQPEGVGGQGIV